MNYLEPAVYSGIMLPLSSILQLKTIGIPKARLIVYVIDPIQGPIKLGLLYSFSAKIFFFSKTLLTDSKKKDIHSWIFPKNPKGYGTNFWFTIKMSLRIWPKWGIYLVHFDPNLTSAILLFILVHLYYGVIVWIIGITEG